MLRKVAAEVVGLLTDGFDHDDPVVGRLFPDIYPDDPTNSAEFRRYTEGDLKTGKIDQAGAILAGAAHRTTGGEVRLDDEAAEAWLRALNDARLAMGVRLDIKDDTDLGDELDDAVLQRPDVEPGLPALRLRLPRLPAGVPAQRAGRLDPKSRAGRLPVRLSRR